MRRLAAAAVLLLGCSPVAPASFDRWDGASDASDDIFSPFFDAEPYHCSDTPCPVAAPTEGTPCVASWACEYGDASRPECNEFFKCVASAWQRSGPTSVCSSDGGSPCPPSALGDAGACVGNGSCSLPDGNCACNSGRWVCYPTIYPSCPRSRPRAGTACGDASVDCPYPELTTPCESEDCFCGVWIDVKACCGG